MLQSLTASVDRVAKAVVRLRVGHGLNPDAETSPMTRDEVAGTCRAQLRGAVDRGALECWGSLRPLALF